MTTTTFQNGMLQSPLENYIEPLLNHLRAASYAERTLRKKRSVTRALGRWMKRKRITADDHHETYVEAFVAR